MSAHSGYVRFQGVIADFSPEYCQPMWEEKERGRELKRPSDKAFFTVFYGFTEISSTVDALVLLEELIGLAPPRSPRIKKDEYLKFLVSAYLQEIYILEQRLTSYAVKLLRIYTVDHKKRASLLQKNIADTFGGLISIRGSHVHERRYTDDKLNTLSSLTLISQYKEELISHVHSEFKLSQREWKKTIKANNHVTQQFLDNYFDDLYPLITKNGKISLPRTGKESTL